jgi:hypothetical protein
MMSATLARLGWFGGWLGRLVRFVYFLRLAGGRGFFAWLAEIPRAAGFTRLLTCIPLAAWRIALVAGSALLPMLALITTPGAIAQLPQGAAQRFDLAFIGELLAFGQFDQLQHFFHLIHGALERFHDLHHLINRLMNGGGPVFRFGPAHPLGQALRAFEQRADRLRGGAGR